MENLKQKYPRFAEAIVKIFAVMGLVIIILIALYGAMAALRSIPNVWQSIGNAFTSVTGIFDNERELDLSVSPQTPVSGDIITINFEDGARGDGNGSYSFSYDCVEGINFEILSPAGNSRTFAFCNTPTTFAVTDGNSVRVIATLVNKDVVSVPIKIAFTRNNDDEASASGETQITVIKSTGANNNPPVNQGNNPPATTTPRTPSGNRPPASNPPSNNNPGYTLIPAPVVPFFYGFADLKVNILEVGKIDKLTGVFTPTANLTTSDRVAVKFEVINAGTNISGNWRFNASLPIEPYYLYSAGSQPLLNPGDKIIYTLGFDGIQNRTVNQFSVMIDPDNIVQESNELNNTVTRNIALINVPLPMPPIGFGIPFSASCTYLSNGTYNCFYNNQQYVNCTLVTNGYHCYNYTNGSNTINLPYGANCYTTGINSAYTCYANSTSYTNCFITSSGYTCYNTSGNPVSPIIPGATTCTANGNGYHTCFSNGIRYNNCVLTSVNTYSCPTNNTGGQTGNYQLPSNSNCQYTSNGSYNCMSSNGTQYSGCFLNSNGWNCTTITNNNQRGCFTTPSGFDLCID